MSWFDWSSRNVLRTFLIQLSTNQALGARCFDLSHWFKPTFNFCQTQPCKLVWLRRIANNCQGSLTNSSSALVFWWKQTPNLWVTDQYPTTTRSSENASPTFTHALTFAGPSIPSPRLRFVVRLSKTNETAKNSSTELAWFAPHTWPHCTWKSKVPGKSILEHSQITK